MRDEGVTKFKGHWKKSDPLPENKLQDLIYYRQRLFRSKLIGVYPDGIGYGNLSQKVNLDGHFIISGSQTGHLPDVGVEHFAKVTGYSVAENRVDHEGPIRASSESLTHAMIYEAFPDVEAVIHVHSPELWKKFKNQVPTTGEKIPYGTPQMAEEIKRLAAEGELRQSGILIMAGHENGVITFGRDLAVAFEILSRHIEIEKTSTVEYQFSNVMYNHGSVFVPFLVFAGICLGIFLFFYFFMTPENSLKDVRAQYFKNKVNTTRITFDIKIENSGSRKTTRGEIFSALLDAQDEDSLATLFAYASESIPDLAEKEITAVSEIKDVDTNLLSNNVKATDGVFMVVALRWTGDKWSSWGRTFQSDTLIFLRPDQGGSTFTVEYLHQSRPIHFFREDIPPPNMAKLIKKLKKLRAKHRAGKA